MLLYKNQLYYEQNMVFSFLFNSDFNGLVDFQCPPRVLPSVFSEFSFSIKLHNLFSLEKIVSKCVLGCKIENQLL